MNQRYKGKRIVIIGATGGLGKSYAKAFLAEGASVLLAGRDEKQLLELSHTLSGDTTVIQADITNTESVDRLASFSAKWAGAIDIVVNATGFDVRKSLEMHQIDEINMSLDTNLRGAILVTKAFLPHMKDCSDSFIVHMGGFADGRMAFPYYSVDVATRSGIFSFAEAINRELEQEGKLARLIYFCPNSADTLAEQPYHKVWKEMGISISSTEEVAMELLKAIEKRKIAYLMGGAPTRLFAKLNALSPKLADQLLLKKYGAILKKYFNSSENDSIIVDKQPIHSAKKLVAIGLVAFSFVLYVLLPVVPFLPVELIVKAVITGSMMIISEIVFWVGGIILGKEIVIKMRDKLNICKWFCCNRPDKII